MGNLCGIFFYIHDIRKDIAPNEVLNDVHIYTVTCGERDWDKFMSWLIPKSIKKYHSFLNKYHGYVFTAGKKCVKKTV